MEPLSCSRCKAPRDQSDNFCRACGHQFTINLPALRRAEGPAGRRSDLPALRSPFPPSLIGSVAVLAVGTGLEWLARRAAGSAARSVGRALIGSEKRPQKQSTPSAVSVDEVLYVRKVQLRR
jgi:hypothetical protein